MCMCVYVCVYMCVCEVTVSSCVAYYTQVRAMVRKGGGGSVCY